MNCPDCAAAVGSPHKQNCDIEECTVCGAQRLGCDCAGHDPLAAAWSGQSPGKAECRARGWYAVLRPGIGWQPCEPDTPGATEDLNRYSFWRQTGQDALYR